MVGRIGWVKDECGGPALTSSPVDVLSSRQLTPHDALCFLYDPVQSHSLLPDGASRPDCDAVCQDALHCAPVRVHQ